MMKRALALVVVLLSTTFLSAQAPVAVDGITRLSGGVQISTRDNVTITADRAELNQKTGEVLLFGHIILRHAGAPFPAPTEVTMRLRGNFQLSVGDLTVSAEEADINGVTGEMALRGNVRLTNPQ